MPANSTAEPPKRGRRKLSPNGIDQECRQADQARRGKQQKPSGSRVKTELAKRRADRLARALRKQLRRHQLKAPVGSTVRRRVHTLRDYERWRARLGEAAAAQQAAAAYQVSPATIRRWRRLYREGGLAALVPHTPGPRNTDQCVSGAVQFLVVALRRLFGWNEKRLAHELAQRGIAQLSHTTVGRIFARYYLPTRTYHTLAKRDGIPKRRYAAAQPNQQWHIDFAETKLADGARVVVIVLIDDYSRFCVCCQVVPDMSSEAALQALQAAWQAFGRPQELVSDNGRAFTPVHAGSLTPCGARLRAAGVHHRLITPYWPEANGKAEAFVKILKHECLNHTFTTREALEQALAAFVTYYNYYRLHGSLGFRPPATRYLGAPMPSQHGLAGLPGLPQALLDAFPPAEPLVPPDPQALRRRYALTLVNC